MYATVLAFAFMIISLRTIATKILYNMLYLMVYAKQVYDIALHIP